MSELVVQNTQDRWDFLIEEWAKAKYQRSQSEATYQAYLKTVKDFQKALQANNLYFDGEIQPLSLFIPRWASHVTRPGKKNLSTASYNRRLAILSSFYLFLKKRDFIAFNPVDSIDRAEVEPYAGAMPLDISTLKRQFYAIDRNTLLGQRDLALLLVAIMTGRRVSELHNLNIGNIAVLNETVMLTWPKTKGGKRQDDIVEPFVAHILTDYLIGYYGPLWKSNPDDTPVWVSLSTHKHGERLSIWGIAAVYERRLGITKVHASRYTFASLMEQLGASMAEIQRKLGHSNISTTGHYLRKAGSAHNKHGAAMGNLLGFGDGKPDV